MSRKWFMDKNVYTLQCYWRHMSSLKVVVLEVCLCTQIMLWYTTKMWPVISKGTLRSPPWKLGFWYHLKADTFCFKMTPKSWPSDVRLSYYSQIWKRFHKFSAKTCFQKIAFKVSVPPLTCTWNSIFIINFHTFSV